jgi:hypothetical protein
MGDSMIEIIESVASSKFELGYIADSDKYIASTKNALGQFSSIGDNPEDANRRLRAKLFSLIASYIEKEKIHS